MVLRSSLPFASNDEFIKDDIYNEGKKAIRTLSSWNPWDGFRIKWRKSYFEFVEIETLMKRNVETLSDIFGGRLEVTSELWKLKEFN